MTPATPRVTREEVSAGGVVFRVAADNAFEIALIRTHEGRWQLPKGWIEEGEAPERTAVREVREETGVDAELVGALDRIEYWYNSTYDPEPVRVHKFVHFYLLRYITGSTDDHDDEVAEARFASIDDALRMLAFKDERNVVSRARDLLATVDHASDREA